MIQIGEQTDMTFTTTSASTRITNADHIRSMTNEELAEWIYQVQDEDSFRKENFLQPLSKSWWLDWLKQESEK